jgi:thiosulfate reductase cytochrome b subunit
MEQVRLYKKHPALVRLSHWAAVLLGSALLWSGTAMLLRDRHLPFQKIVPGALVAATSFGLPKRSFEQIHLLAAPVLIAAGLLYVGYLVRSGRWRTIVPQRSSWADAIAVVLADLGLRRHVPTQVKYNGAQRIAYSAAILMGAGFLLTGAALYFSRSFPILETVLGGRSAVVYEHVGLMVAIVAFSVVHVAQVLRAGRRTLAAMVTGTEVLQPRTRLCSTGPHDQALPEFDRVTEISKTAEHPQRNMLSLKRAYGFKSVRQFGGTRPAGPGTV